MDASPIIIAGGGIAGLAAALALGPHDALILEQAPTFTNAGAGIQLGPNAVRALQKIGAWDAVAPQATKPTEIQFRDGVSGMILKRLPLGPTFVARFGADYHVAHRAQLHAALLQVVRSKPNIQLQLGKALHHLELGANDIQIRVGSQSHRAPALIAADGVQSNLRQTLFPGTPAETGKHTFHRALLTVPSALQTDYVTVWMMPHGHVVHYCIGDPAQLNLVAITPNDKTPQQFFQHATPELANTLQLAMPTFTTWPDLYVQPLSRWTNGSTLLLGDAAHGTLPYMAQGAAMALEDAACLSQAITSNHSLRHAFAETAKRRMARTRRVHTETLRTGKTYHATTPLRQLRNIALSTLPEQMMLRKLDWLYGTKQSPH
jgi:salicylate hydroxylase